LGREVTSHRRFSNIITLSLYGTAAPRFSYFLSVLPCNLNQYFVLTSFPCCVRYPSRGKRQSRMVVFPTLSYPTTISLDLKRGSPLGDRNRSSMYSTIFLVPRWRISMGIIPSPSKDSSFMSSTLQWESASRNEIYGVGKWMKGNVTQGIGGPDCPA